MAKIIKDSIYDYVSQGHFTFQIPEFSIGIVEPKETIPDNFLMSHVSRGRSPGRMPLGNESGFLYLSREGFEYYKDELMDCYFDWVSKNGLRMSDRIPTTRQEFITMARQWYSKVEYNTQIEKNRRIAKGMKV